MYKSSNSASIILDIENCMSRIQSYKSSNTASIGWLLNILREHNLTLKPINLQRRSVPVEIMNTNNLRHSYNIGIPSILLWKTRDLFVFIISCGTKSPAASVFLSIGHLFYPKMNISKSGFFQTVPYLRQ